MEEYLFISQSFLVENSKINGNVDFEKLRPTIIAAQDIYLQQILGTPMYEDLQTKGLSSPLGFSADELLLIRKYIQKTVMWYVMMNETIGLKFKFMNKGVMVKNSDNSQAADTRDLLMLKDECRNFAEQYAELLTNYLKFTTNSITKFPKYWQPSCVGLDAAVTNYTTGIVLDDHKTYGDEENREKIIISAS